MQEDTLVIRNTYLDVPPEWLGEKFFEEAELLKEINPRAYEHEYLGKAIGTGGNVFPNVEYLDMEQLVDSWGGKLPMWKTFDCLYFGIDWGFALDPFRFVKMYFDSKHLDLYIFDEYSTKQTRNETIYKVLYDEKKLISRQDLIIADSAEPKSIADFKAYGALIKPVSKYADSVRDGIKWLQGLRHIYIDKKRCPETWNEFSKYEYECDKDGEFYSAYPDKDNHSIDAVRYAMSKYWRRKGN